MLEFLPLVSGAFGVAKTLFGQRMNAALLALVCILGFLLWTERGSSDPGVVIVLAILFLATCVAWLSTALWPVNLVRNGSFREGVEHWGTGYLEDEIRDGTPEHTDDAGRLPFCAHPSHRKTVTSGNHDLTRKRAGRWRRKSNSYRFMFAEPRTAEKWGSLSQRINGLRRNTAYIVRFYARGSSSDPDAFFFTGSLTWEPHYFIPPTSSWVLYEMEFYSHHSVGYAEIRFVIQGPGEFWITDVAVRVPVWKRNA
jgi:hypothetical protein